MEYINIIEEILATELTEKGMEDYHINPYQLHELHFSLTNYYKRFALPQKSQTRLRPYLSPRYAYGKIASMGYTSGVFNPKKPEFVLEKSVKKTLLYSHEVCVQDPLTYLLDYFHNNPENKIAAKKIPVIKHIFKEIARMKPLIENGLLYIVSDEVFPGLNNWRLISDNMDLEKEVESKIGEEKFDSMDFHQLIQSMYEQFVLQQDIDLYFPDESFKNLYKSLLDVNQQTYTSRDIITPYNFGMLGGLNQIDTEKINIKDVIIMRQHEKVFEDWRLLISETFKELETNTGDFTDTSREFKNIISDQNRKFDSEILKRAQQSTFYSNLPKTKEKIFAGVASNFILNASLPNDLTPSTGSLLNSVFTSFLELIINSKADRKQRTIRASLHNNFLSIK